MKLRTSKDGEGTRGAAIWCTPCGHAHHVPISGANAWGWNGDYERPTLTPSLKVTRPGDDKYCCHSVVTDGNIAYCNDSSHALAGQTVPLEDFPMNYGGAWDDADKGKKMHFELQPPFVLVHDNKPGSHATLFGTHERFGTGVARYPFNGERSCFNNATSEYTWAFEVTPVDGEVLVFATADREIVAEFVDASSRLVWKDGGAPHFVEHAVHPAQMRVYRVTEAGGKPLTLVGAG